MVRDLQEQMASAHREKQNALGTVDFLRRTRDEQAKQLVQLAKDRDTQRREVETLNAELRNLKEAGKMEEALVRVE